MKVVKTIIAAFALPFLLSACAQHVSIKDRPDWVDNPGSNYIGQCGTHIKGRIAQKQCAYKKGITYLAMSKGVSVDVNSDITMKQSSTEKSGSSFGQLQASVKMDEKNIKISASIIDNWHDKVADIMYVLIKEN